MGQGSCDRSCCLVAVFIPDDQADRPVAVNVEFDGSKELVWDGIEDAPGGVCFAMVGNVDAHGAGRRAEPS